jgi:hypothetical protein
MILLRLCRPALVIDGVVRREGEIFEVDGALADRLLEFGDAVPADPRARRELERLRVGPGWVLGWRR